MELETGSTYHFDLKADLGLFGKRDVRVSTTIDSPTTFHGYAHLMGEPLRLLGYEVDESMRLIFDEGVIEGDNLAFSVAEGALSASFRATIAPDNTVTGSGEAGGLLRIKLAGTVCKA